MNAFKENFPDFPRVDVCPAERPDFLIKDANAITGIEMTHFYRQMSNEAQSPLQQRERIREQIRRQAQSTYDSCGSDPVHVHIHFDLNFNCRASEIGPIAERLVGLAKFSLPDHTQKKIWNRDEVQIPGVAMLHVKRTRLPKSYWRAPLGTFVPELRPEQLQSILDKKSALCCEYLTKCDRVWLIIVMNRFQASSFSLITSDTVENFYRHGFDAAFLYFHDYPDGQKPPYLLRNHGHKVQLKDVILP